VLPGRGLTTVARGAWRSPAVRLVAGIVISAAFLAVTVSRVDLGETAQALAGAAPAASSSLSSSSWSSSRSEPSGGGFSSTLQPRFPLRSAFAYLSIGYFANLLLPARLGDVARAYLAARSLGISTLVTLGTVVVERVSDTAVILIVVLVAGLAVAPRSEVAGWAELIALVAVIGLALVAVVGILLLRSGLLDRRFGRQVRSIVARVAEGGAALRRPSGAALILGLTVLPFGVAVCTFGAISGALGLPLDPVEWRSSWACWRFPQPSRPRRAPWAHTSSPA